MRPRQHTSILLPQCRLPRRHEISDSNLGRCRGRASPGALPVVRRQGYPAPAAESMQAWMERGIPRDRSTGLWDEESYQFGDWLDPYAPPDDPGNSITDPMLVANAYLVEMTRHMHEICLALGLAGPARSYGEAAAELRRHSSAVTSHRKDGWRATSNGACLEHSLPPVRDPRARADRRAAAQAPDTAKLEV